MRKLCMLLAGGGVLVLLTSTVSLASGNRAANLKSHGTLEYQSETQDVLLTAHDLTALANDMDYLEGILDALNQKNNPHIVYEYHTHEDGAGNTYGDGKTFAGSTSPGGCYTVGYHVHRGCPSHRNCPRNCHEVHLADGSGSYWVHDCITSYDCSSPVNTWACDKKSGQLVGAHISFE